MKKSIHAPSISKRFVIQASTRSNYYTYCSFYAFDSIINANNVIINKTPNKTISSLTSIPIFSTCPSLLLSHFKKRKINDHRNSNFNNISNISINNVANIKRRAFSETAAAKSPTSFDTSQLVQKLESEGFTRQQSEAIMNSLAEVISER